MAARFDFAHLVDNIKSSRHFQKNLFPHGLLEDALATNVSPNIAFALVRASAAINWMNAHG